MGKSISSSSCCCNATPLGTTLMPKHSGKKTKGLTKKQMKLPKALRDAILKKKKKQKGVYYAISQRWSFQRNEKDQEEQDEEKEKKEIILGWGFFPPCHNHGNNYININSRTNTQIIW